MAKVYVKIKTYDTTNVIIDINSDNFITDITGWILIDQGEGDKYSHAQGNYLDKGLVDENCKCNYKLVDEKVVGLTDDEKESIFSTPEPGQTEEEKQLDLINNLIVDNLNMQAQIDSLITSTLGGN